jgi:hypothetical protein
LALISLSRSTVNFILDVFAGAGAAVWAEAVSRLPATSNIAARQTLMRSIVKFP